MEIISRKPRPNSVYDFQFSVLFDCILSCPLALRDVFHVCVESAIKHQLTNSSPLAVGLVVINLLQ